MPDTKSHINAETIVEALIFAAPEPVHDAKLARIAGVPREQIGRIIDELNKKYESATRSFEIRRVAAGYAIYVKQDFAPWLEELLGGDRGIHLTRPMFEVLAIVAVKQPITKPVIDKIRGVNSSAPLAQLLKSGLITITGRQSGPGRPFEHGTTRKFLKIFGLNSPQDIPSFEELQKMFEGTENSS